MRISPVLAIGVVAALAACSVPPPSGMPVQLASAAPLTGVTGSAGPHYDPYCDVYPFMCRTMPVQIASAALDGSPLTRTARPPGAPDDPYCDSYPFLYGYGFYQGGRCGPNPYYFGFGGVLFTDVLRFTSQHRLVSLNNLNVPNIRVTASAMKMMAIRRR